MNIIDSHVHFWDPERFCYLWLEDILSLKRPFLPVDYIQATLGTEISGLVFVQADCLSEQGLSEVDWVAGLEAPVLAIVGFAPLELGDAVSPHLEKLRQRPLVKGVRRIIQSEEAEFSIKRDFVRGVQKLAEYDFCFDICVKHHQLPAVIELVQYCPEVKFVLDHVGKPDIARGGFESWRDHISSLAGFTNVWCKLSGVITEANWDRWTVEEIRLYLAHVLEAFGIDRVMFGSDWPVVNLAGSFTVWLDALQWVVNSLNNGEKRKMFSENAGKFYGIN